jgi:hypothetical protein
MAINERTTKTALFLMVQTPILFIAHFTSLLIRIPSSFQLDAPALPPLLSRLICHVHRRQTNSPDCWSRPGRPNAGALLEKSNVLYAIFERASSVKPLSKWLAWLDRQNTAITRGTSVSPPFPFSFIQDRQSQLVPRFFLFPTPGNIWRHHLRWQVWDSQEPTWSPWSPTNMLTMDPLKNCKSFFVSISFIQSYSLSANIQK